MSLSFKLVCRCSACGLAAFGDCACRAAEATSLQYFISPLDAFLRGLFQRASQAVTVFEQQLKLGTCLRLFAAHQQVSRNHLSPSLLILGFGSPMSSFLAALGQNLGKVKCHFSLVCSAKENLIFCSTVTGHT